MTLQTIKDVIKFVEYEYRKLSFFLEDKKQKQSQTILNLLFDQWKNCVQSKSEKKLQEYLFLSEDVVLEKLEIQKQGENSEVTSSDLNQPLSRLNRSIKDFYAKYNNDKKCADSLALKIKRNNGENLRLEPEINGKSIVIWAYVKLLEQIPPSDKSLTTFVSAQSVLEIENGGRNCSQSPEFFRISGPEFVDFENDCVFIDEKQIKNIQNKLKEGIVVLEAGPASGKSVLARSIAYKRIKKDPLNQFTTVFFNVSNNEFERVSELAERISFLNENNLLIIEDAHLNSRLINQLLQRRESFRAEILITTRRINEIPGGEKNLFDNDAVIRKIPIDPASTTIEEIISRYLKNQKNQFQFDLKTRDIINLIEESYNRHFFYNVNLWLLSFLLDALKVKETGDQIFIEKHEIVRAVEKHLNNRIGSLFEQEGKKPLAIKLLISLSCLYRFEFLTDIYWLQERFRAIGYNKDDVITVLQKLHRFGEIRYEGNTLYGLHHSALAELYFAVGQARYLPWQEEKVYGDYGEIISSYLVSTNNGLKILEYHSVNESICYSLVSSVIKNEQFETHKMVDIFQVLPHRLEEEIFEYIDRAEFSEFLLEKWGHIIDSSENSEELMFYFRHSYSKINYCLVSIKIDELFKALETNIDLRITCSYFRLLRNLLDHRYYSFLLLKYPKKNLIDQIELSYELDTICSLFDIYEEIDLKHTQLLWDYSKHKIFEKFRDTEDYKIIVNNWESLSNISQSIGDEIWEESYEKLAEKIYSFDTMKKIYEFMKFLYDHSRLSTVYEKLTCEKLLNFIISICTKSESLYRVIFFMKLYYQIFPVDAEKVWYGFLKSVPKKVALRAESYGRIYGFLEVVMCLELLKEIENNFFEQLTEIIMEENSDAGLGPIYDEIKISLKSFCFNCDVLQSATFIYKEVCKVKATRELDLDFLLNTLDSQKTLINPTRFMEHLGFSKNDILDQIVRHNNIYKVSSWVSKIYQIDEDLGDFFWEDFWQKFELELRTNQFEIHSLSDLSKLISHSHGNIEKKFLKNIFDNDLIPFVFASIDERDMLIFIEQKIGDDYALALKIWKFFEQQQYFEKLINSMEYSSLITCLKVDLLFDSQDRMNLWGRMDKSIFFKAVDWCLGNNFFIDKLLFLIKHNEACWVEIKKNYSILYLAEKIANDSFNETHDLILTIFKIDRKFGIKLWYEIFSLCLPIKVVVEASDFYKS